MDITLIIPPVSNRVRTKSSADPQPQTSKKFQSPRIVAVDPRVLNAEQKPTKKTKSGNQNKAKDDSKDSGEAKKGKQ